MDDQLEDLFRQRLDGHEEEPPAGAWNRIQEDIKPPARKPRAIAGWLLAALLLLSLGTAVMFVKLFVPASNLADGAKNQPIAAEKPAIQEDYSDNNSSTASTAAKETANGNQTSEITTTDAANEVGKANGISATGPAGSKNTGITTESSANKTTIGRNNTPVNPETGAALLAQNNNLQKGNKEKNTRKGSEKALALAGGVSNNNRSNYSTSGKAAAEGKNMGTAAQNNSTNNPAGTENNSTENQSQATPPLAVTNPGNTVVANPETAQENTVAAITDSSATAPDSVLTKAIAQADSALTPPEEKAPEQNDFKSTTRFGFFAGSQLNNRKFSPNQKDELYIKDLKNKNQDYPERINLTAGALVQRSFTPRIALEAGLGIVYSRDKIEFEATSGETTPVETSFTSTGLSLATTKIYRNHKTENAALYTSLRTGAVLSVLQSSFANVSLAGGGLLNVLSWDKSVATIDGKETESTFNPNRLQGGVYAGLRFSSPLSRRLDLAIEPGINYFFNSTQKQEQPFQIQTHTYNVNVLFYLR